MKTKKLSVLIASCLVASSTIAVTTLPAYADTLQPIQHSQEHIQNTDKQFNNLKESSNMVKPKLEDTNKPADVKVENVIKPTNIKVGNISKSTNDKIDKSTNIVEPNHSVIKEDKIVSQPNITHNTIKKVQQQTRVQQEAPRQINNVQSISFAAAPLTSNEIIGSNGIITFKNNPYLEQFNGMGLHQLQQQTSFSSQTSENLYNYLMNKQNRIATMNEAISLHDGVTTNDCVFFASTALRHVGVPIPDSVGYTTVLENYLEQNGWQQEYDLNDLQPGDICFASVYHAFTFMGWANKQHTVAWVADNQSSWYGSHLHPRNLYGNPEYSDPTTSFWVYRGGGSVNINPQPSQPTTINNTNKVLGIGTVNGDDLNVRTSPNIENNNIIGQLNTGNKVQVTGQSGLWWQIKYNGKVAYVYKEYIDYSPNATPVAKPVSKPVVKPKQQPVPVVKPKQQTSNKPVVKPQPVSKPTVKPQPTPVVKPQPTPVVKPQNTVPSKKSDIISSKKYIGTINVTSNSYLNVRTGNSINYNILGKLYAGQKVEILGSTSNGWLKINYNGQTAYIDGQYVNTTKSNSPSQSTQVSATGTVNVLPSSYLNVRTGDSTVYSILGQLYSGQKINIIGKTSNGWLKINYNGQTAYVDGQYVNIGNNNNQPSQQSNGTVSVSYGSSLNVRSNPYESNNIIGSLSNNQKVTILGVSGDWYKISYNGNIGYVYSSYVNRSTKSYVNGHVVNVYSYLHVRQQPSLGGNIIGDLQPNSNVQILGSTNGWYKINFNGQIGYVYSAYIAY